MGLAWCVLGNEHVATGVHSDGYCQAFPHVKPIFTGIGILLAVRILAVHFSPSFNSEELTGGKGCEREP